MNFNENLLRINYKDVYGTPQILYCNENDLIISEGVWNINNAFELGTYDVTLFQLCPNLECSIYDPTIFPIKYHKTIGYKMLQDIPIETTQIKRSTIASHLEKTYEDAEDEHVLKLKEFRDNGLDKEYYKKYK